jgi:predicted aspartyl protease
VEKFAKEEVTEIVTEEFEIPQLKPRYFRGKLDNQFEKFMEVVRRLSINMPLLDAFPVPTYSRYFKDILANKYEIATLGVDHVKMSKQCSTAIANILEKQGDHVPLIPCSPGSFKFAKALCDLGASVSIIPRDVFEKLRLPKSEPTTMCLELGDNSIHYPLGIVVNVPIKVGQHFIPVDFVVLEMGEMEKPPLILGRTFLKTVGATIDVGNGEIKFDINNKRSSFKFRPHFKVCNMIKVKFIPPHHHIGKEEPRKEEDPEKKEGKEIKEVVASVKIREQKSPVMTKNMTKLENKHPPKMVQKWVPKIAMPAKSIDPK